MASRHDVEVFLNDFRAKLNIWGVLFLDSRGKNTQALLDLDIHPKEREEVIKKIQATDYVDGPTEDVIFNGSDMWVFGKGVNNRELYIKITMGRMGQQVICISFHPSEHPLSYPHK